MIVERLDPDTTDDVHNRELHLERYRWASERLSSVRGGRVLDVACGTGYGAAILASGSGAPDVLGIDRSSAAIETARARYAAERVRFAEVEDALTFSSAEPFQAAVSLETLEHLPQPGLFLRRLHALLAPGGRLVVSAPVAERPGDNPFHLHCFTPRSLRALVSEGFAIEAELDQRRAYLTLLARRKEEAATSPAWSRAEAAPCVSVVLVTHDGLEETLDLVSAIRAFTRLPHELVVVDNASRDGVRAYLRLFEGEPGYTLVENAENLRCAGATNQALALARGEYVAYLCARHALVSGPDWDDALVDFLAAHPEIDLAGDVWSPGFWLEGRRYRAGWRPALEELLHVQGGAWIARRSLFERFGPFAADEYPHGGMDVELSYRLLSHGCELGAHPAVACPPAPRVPEVTAGVLVYHPAPLALRRALRGQLGLEPVPPTSAGVPTAAEPTTAVALVPESGNVAWTVVRGTVRWSGPDAFLAAGQDRDCGLLSRARYRDLVVSCRIELQTGEAIVKLRTGSHARDADGYHALLRPGAGYLARAGHVLARFALPPGPWALAFEARGPELRLALGGVPLARVRDPLLREGHLLLGACHGAVQFSDLRVEGLDVEAPEAAPTSAGPSGPPVLVFCERLDNESIAESVVDALATHYDVRPFGPGWPHERLVDVELAGARFYLELDAVSGNFPRPAGLAALTLPKFAWLVDTHKKPDFHRAIAREVDHTFFSMQRWGHVFDRPASWLPVHCDPKIFRPLDRPRVFDVTFVGSHSWRVAPLERVAARHSLRLHVACTTGPREKSETAELYAQSKLVFNRHVADDLNFRVVEAMACGRVLLTDAQWNGQYELFEDGVHYALYKDERDLERLVLRYLEDDEARARIERAAAAHALAAHSTPARVAQLVTAIEAHLHERERSGAVAGSAAATVSRPANVARVGAALAQAVAPPTAPATPRPAADLLPARPRLRLAVFAGEEPATVALASYGERLALDLAERGHEVVLLRRRRCALPPPALVGLRLIELDPGPVPRPLTAANRLLAEATALHVRLHAHLAEIVAAEGAFDAVLGEGPQGGLVLAPWAARSGTPFLLALEDCEVRARGNRLNREQLYLAELEQWSADRALAVVAPSAAVVEAVAAHYRHERVTRIVAAAHLPAPPAAADRQRLLSALGVPEVFGLCLVPLTPGQAQAVADEHARGDVGCSLVAGDELWQIEPGEPARRLSTHAVRGPALAALMLSARSVDVRCDDARAAEVEALRGAPASHSLEALRLIEELLSRREERVPALL